MSSDLVERSNIASMKSLPRTSADKQEMGSTVPQKSAFYLICTPTYPEVSIQPQFQGPLPSLFSAGDIFLHEDTRSVGKNTNQSYNRKGEV